eukprot:11489864-Heterocapsa_arctica.AAC.1
MAMKRAHGMVSRPLVLVCRPRPPMRACEVQAAARARSDTDRESDAMKADSGQPKSTGDGACRALKAEIRAR